MDSIKAKKLLAMRRYKRAQFLNNLTFYSLTTSIFCLFCTHPFWFPLMKHFLYVSLPTVLSFLFSPKCVFFVGNIIVFVLVRESKHRGSNSSEANEIYDGCSVERNQSLGGKSMELIDEENKELREMNVVIVEDYNEVESIIIDDDLVEEVQGIGAEELNRRVEDFIARVNRQRWLDEKKFTLQQQQRLKNE